MPNRPTGRGGNVYVIEGFWTPENHPNRTGHDNLIDYTGSYMNTMIRNGLRDQWLEVDTDAIEKETGVKRRKQWTVYRAMAMRGEISFKRVNTKTFIKLKPNEIIDVPIARPKRIKGPVEYLDGVAHYKWCMTCKTEDNLTPSGLSHNKYEDVRHYICNDCQATKKDRANVPFRKYETERQQRKRYQKLYNDLKTQYGIIRSKRQDQ